MDKLRTALLGICLVLLPTVVAADAVRLSSGQVIEGKILEQSTSTVIIRTRNGNVSIDRRDILEVEVSGSSARIARIKTKKPTPERAALLSLIPFYSGMYQGDEPGFAVPLAMAAGGYFLRFLQSYSGVNYTDWDNSKKFNQTAELVLYNSYVLNESSAGAGTAQAIQALIYWNTRISVPVYGTKVGGTVYTSGELGAYRRRVAKRWILSAGLSAGLSYAYFRWIHRWLGASRNIESSPGLAGRGLDLKQIYATPTFDRPVAGIPPQEGVNRGWQAGLAFSF